MDGGKALILRRSATSNKPGLWNLPGGGMEKGETTEQSAIRELFEETGLRPLTIHHFKTVDGKNRSYHTYISEGYIGDISLDLKENDKYAWVSIEDLDQYDYVPRVRDLLLAVL